MIDLLARLLFMVYYSTELPRRVNLPSLHNMAEYIPGSMEFDSSDIPYSALSWTEVVHVIKEPTLPSISSLCPKVELPLTSITQALPPQSPETPLLNQLLGFSKISVEQQQPALELPFLDLFPALSTFPEVYPEQQAFWDGQELFQYGNGEEQYFVEPQEYHQTFDLYGAVEQQSIGFYPDLESPMNVLDMQLDNGQLFLTSPYDWYSSLPVETSSQDFVASSPYNYSLSDGSDYQIRTPPLECSLSHGELPFNSNYLNLFHHSDTQDKR